MHCGRTKRSAASTRHSIGGGHAQQLANQDAAALDPASVIGPRAALVHANAACPLRPAHALQGALTPV